MIKIVSLFKRLKFKLLNKSSITNPELIDAKASVFRSEISGNVKVGPGSIIRDSTIIVKNLAIGTYSSLWGPSIMINANINEVIIGNFCSIGKNVTIQEYSHDYSKLSSYFIATNLFGEDLSGCVTSKGPIIIGSDVWIASNVVIGSGVRVGDGSVIAAGSVVLNDVPPFAIVAGAPARVLRYRFTSEVIDRLVEISWWKWDFEKIKKNKSLFERVPTLTNLQEIF
ncbi:CatB-related O-acetyltransferase [Polynucleobacter sp. AP-Kaivos-20-H2]|uniref:CatB-related O-acetyltransferase n=1 Tax=Polynucleobacter sp. AP-Kaivos-20-H2 TaxID=2689104 RepID=UPI001C0BF6FC|nr:CatB-related O-acetyltransferase [Polynucleobacter sp. AP-Kaivos-20-H2]MBU3604127.1 antibiotic acetyltransferase [Polynucleobacter sp. AP-Kaivos-20-H2]